MYVLTQLTATFVCTLRCICPVSAWGYCIVIHSTVHKYTDTTVWPSWLQLMNLWPSCALMRVNHSSLELGSEDKKKQGIFTVHTITFPNALCIFLFVGIKKLFSFGQYVCDSLISICHFFPLDSNSRELCHSAMIMDAAHPLTAKLQPHPPASS